MCLRFGSEGTWCYPGIRKTFSRVNVKDTQHWGRPLGVAGSLCGGWWCDFRACSAGTSQSELGRWGQRMGSMVFTGLNNTLTRCQTLGLIGIKPQLVAQDPWECGG
jgi:hypothetical protein